jgi:[ribosomal protein S18]-alanine N-acetyltransferase
MRRSAGDSPESDPMTKTIGDTLSWQAEAAERGRGRVGPEAGGTQVLVEIERLSYADLPHVIAIERRSFPAPWSLAMFVLELSKPSSICLGARHHGELVGYLVCSRYHTVWHIMNVAVETDYRRLGVATMLIERLFGETDDRGERYTLEVRVSNAEAIKMYESFGFRSAGIRRRYYHDNNEDALIMWRTHPGVGGEMPAPRAH